MKILVAVIAASLIALSSSYAAAYSTEATVTPQEDGGTYVVNARVAELVQQDGDVVERVISMPRLTAKLGEGGSVYVGGATRECWF